MNRQPYEKPPRWWESRVAPFWVRAARPWRKWTLHGKQRFTRIDVHGLDHVRGEVAAGHGLLITPNHSAHYDSNALYDVADQLGHPFHFMTAWQVFAKTSAFGQWSLQRHGCFSVDREGNDKQAFKHAVELLRDSPYPLVIFPEGDVYHVTDRVSHFREGAAAIALSAARKANREVRCVPCGIKFHYVDDPTDELLRLMTRLEERFYLRPLPEKPLGERIYRLAGSMLALKEIEYFGASATGAITERCAGLAERILRQLEERHAVAAAAEHVPERLKELRRRVIQAMSEPARDEAARRRLAHDMEDLFLVGQLFSYPGDYLLNDPSIERLAETLDKLEEDVFGVDYPTVRGRRRVTIRFGEPIAVENGDERRDGVARLTARLRDEVQTLVTSIDQRNGSARNDA